MNTCKNCGATFDSKYCPECGTAAQVKRIDTKYLGHEIEHAVFHVEKGFFYTGKELLLRPGLAVRQFLEGNRAKHFKPIGYVIICSILYSLVNHQLHMDHGPENTNPGLKWVAEHYNYSNLIEILFIGLSLSFFFRKKGYSYVEYLVLLCYLTGFLMLLSTLVLVAAYLITPALLTIILWISILYYTWGIGQFFNDRKFVTYLKAFLAYAVGAVLFFGSAYLVGKGLLWIHPVSHTPAH